MADYTFNVYLTDPFSSGFLTAAGTFTYSPTTTAVGTVVITDNETGNDGATLDDNIGGSQETATATVTTPTTTYTDIPVNADHGWTLYDPIDDVTFEVILLNGKAGSISFRYTLSEYPLVAGRDYQIIQYDNQPNAQVLGEPYFTYADYVCFTRGCRLRTADGWKLVEDLKVGGLLWTLDHGPQEIRWIGHRRVRASAEKAPILIKAGTLGNTNDIRVSPQHKVMLSGWKCEILFGTPDVLIAVKHLVDDDRIVKTAAGLVDYFHILLDNHQILDCDGAHTESFHPGKQGEIALTATSRAQIIRIFPHLTESFDNYGPSARRVLRSFEVPLLTSHSDASVKEILDLALAS